MIGAAKASDWVTPWVIVYMVSCASVTVHASWLTFLVRAVAQLVFLVRSFPKFFFVTLATTSCRRVKSAFGMSLT